jgi:hypothetical protein
MRYLESLIEDDLRKKMVFLSGPRQCGKTTLAKSIQKKTSWGGRYLNWDSRTDKKAILAEQWRNNERLIIFDELHKYPRWKSWLKGIYDTQHDAHAFLITGSARMDIYKRGGDSMFGRHHTWRLHPFSLSERPRSLSMDETLRRLLHVGGFPEPFFDNDERAARRWHAERFKLLLREDVRDLEQLRNVQMLELLVEALRTRVGGGVVASNLAGELEVAPRTVQRWLMLLERMYYTFNIYPVSKNVVRAIKKPPKVYFFDNMDVEGDEGARFENLVATQLLKETQFLEDRDGYRYTLNYIRDKEHREVDFAIFRNGKLLELIEVKWSDSTVSKSLQHFAERLKPVRATQIICNLKHAFHKGNLFVTTPQERFASLEYLTAL